MSPIIQFWSSFFGRLVIFVLALGTHPNNGQKSRFTNNGTTTLFLAWIWPDLQLLVIILVQCTFGDWSLQKVGNIFVKRRYHLIRINCPSFVLMGGGGGGGGYIFLFCNKLCKQMCATQMPPSIQSHPNDDIIYCAFLVVYIVLKLQI